MERDICPRCGKALTVAGSTNPGHSLEQFCPHLKRTLHFWWAQYEFHIGASN